MLQSIKYNLANLANLHGRDARQTFWYYILFLVFIQFGIGIIISIPLYITLFSNIFEAASQGADPDIVMQTMVGEMAGQVRLQVVLGMILGTIVALLMVASFVRRLHDAGFSGWIAVVPFALHFASMLHTLSYLDRMQEIMIETMAESMANPSAAQSDPFAMQAEMSWMGVIGYIAYIVVIGFGVLKSQYGPNAYGDEPVRF